MLKNVTKTYLIFIGFSLAACVAPTGPQTLQPGDVVADTDDAQVAVADQAIAQSNPVVAPEFDGGGLSWARNGSLIFRYAAIERNGEVFICGAFTGRGSTNVRKASREAMRQAKATVNGQVVLRDLRYFTEASNASWDAGLVGTETSCRSTGQSVEAVPLNAVRVEMRQGRYRVRL